MATLALDLATLGHALATLEEAFLGGPRDWVPHTKQQYDALQWFIQNRDICLMAQNVLAKASTNADELNAFLIEHGFPGELGQIEDGFGVVSILDLPVRWAYAGTVTSLRRTEGAALAEYDAFLLPDEAVQIYVTEYGQLAGLATESGHTLWLMMMPQFTHELELALFAERLISNGNFTPSTTHRGAIIPMLDLNVQPDLSWLCGAGIEGTQLFISQALQYLRLRANELGAHLEAATAVTVERALDTSGQPSVLRFDRPFMGFFTAPDGSLAFGAFYADTDSWKRPTAL